MISNTRLSALFHSNHSRLQFTGPWACSFSKAAAIGVAALMLCAVLPTGAGASKRETPQQAAGDLDPTFDSVGIVTGFFGASTFGNSVVQQSDGKLVAAGLTIQISADDEAFGGTEVNRYNPDGSPDVAYGNLGTVTFGPAFGFGVSTMAIQPDDRVVLLGSDTTDSKFELLRLNTDGSVDTTFGGGQVLTTFSQRAVGFALAIQPDGKIIAGGGAGGSVAVARYNPDGSVDSTFGTNGQVTFQNTSAVALSLAVQSDGKIAIGGISGAGVFFAFNFLGVIHNAQFLVARLNTDGSLDTHFGTNGVNLLSIGAGAMVSQIALQSNGDIVAGGISEQSSGVLDFAMVRYTPDGTTDTSFGSGGQVLTNFDGQSDAIFGLSVQSDGKIVAAGASLVPFSSPSDQVSPASRVHPSNLSFVFMFGIGNGKIALARYNTDGSLDSTFGSDGIVTTVYNQGAAAFSSLIQSDGKIVVAGTGVMGTVPTLIIARYDSGLAVPVFSITVNQASQTVTAGASATYSVGVQTPSGLTPPSGQVALSATVSPSSSGITTTFTPSSVSGAGTSTLAVTTAANTTPATYTITVSGVSSGVTESATATLIVTGAGFSIGFSPASVSTQPGSKVPVTVLIDRVGGFAGKVTVQAPSSLPSGISVKGASEQATRGSSVVFKLKVSSAAAAGSDQLVFTATDAAGQTQSATLTLVVQ